MSQKGTDFWCGKQYAVHETGFLADTLPAVTWTASCVWIELSILGSAWVKWAGDQVSHPTLEWQFSTQHYYRTIAVTISPLSSGGSGSDHVPLKQELRWSKLGSLGMYILRYFFTRVSQVKMKTCLGEWILQKSFLWLFKEMGIIAGLHLPCWDLFAFPAGRALQLWRKAVFSSSVNL